KFGDIRVGASQEPIVNAELRPVAAKIEVSVVAPTGAELAKTSPAIERTLPSQVLTEIPISSAREVSRFALVAPTVSRAPGSNEFAANGQRARNANFTIDGVDNNDNTITTFGLRTPPEAVRELQIQTTPFSAEFGRNTGPQVTVIT